MIHQTLTLKQRLFTAAMACLLPMALFAHSPNLVKDPGFEKTNEAWALFIPGEAKDKGCTLTFESGGRTGLAAKLAAKDHARFSVAEKTQIPVKPGERYRLTAWIKAGAGAELKAGAVGPHLRGTMVKADGKDGDHQFVLLDGRAMGLSGFGSAKGPSTLPTGWHKMSGDITVPADVVKMGFNFLTGYVKGDLLVDDIAIEKVAEASAAPAPTANATPAPKAVASGLLGFETEGWNGGTRIQDLKKEGQWALRWTNHLKNPLVSTDKHVKDQSGTTAFRFWVYSAVANQAVINVVLTSRKDPKVFSYYQSSFKVDFTGWKQISIPVKSMAASREPVGFQLIDGIQFNADGWSQKPKADTDLVLDAIEFVKGN